MIRMIQSYPIAPVGLPRPVYPSARYGYPLAGLGVTTMMPFIERDDALWIDNVEARPVMSFTGDVATDQGMEIRTEEVFPGEKKASNMLLYLGIGAGLLFALTMVGKRRRA